MIIDSPMTILDKLNREFIGEFSIQNILQFPLKCSPMNMTECVWKCSLILGLYCSQTAIYHHPNQEQGGDRKVWKSIALRWFLWINSGIFARLSHNAVTRQVVRNPFPHIDTFWRLCGRQLFGKTVTKEEIT